MRYKPLPMVRMYPERIAKFKALGADFLIYEMESRLRAREFNSRFLNAQLDAMFAFQKLELKINKR